MNQLKAFVDVCHVYGLAVTMDVVHNHAGGDLDRHSLEYLDQPEHPDKTNSLSFSDRDWAGGRVFAFDRAGVRSFLIGNATMFLRDYHADGLRFDEVTVIDGAPGGWSLCQDMTATLRYQKPSAALIAEYWGEFRALAVQPAPQGMGFDLGYADGLREAVRGALGQAAGGAAATIDLTAVRNGLLRPWNYPAAWQAYNCIENHDLVLDADDHRQPRIPALAGGNDTRSWYARSRSRVAMGLLLTAPGVPMLVMGQEFLEDKSTVHDYDLGFPSTGSWREAFDSDYYDHFPNQLVQGNGGSVVADGRPLHDLPFSATITIPANGVLVFARDGGD